MNSITLTAETPEALAALLRAMVARTWPWQSRPIPPWAPAGAVWIPMPGASLLQTAGGTAIPYQIVDGIVLPYTPPPPIVLTPEEQARDDAFLDAQRRGS